MFNDIVSDKKGNVDYALSHRGKSKSTTQDSKTDWAFLGPGGKSKSYQGYFQSIVAFWISVFPKCQRTSRILDIQSCKEQVPSTSMENITILTCCTGLLSRRISSVPTEQHKMVKKTVGNRIWRGKSIWTCQCSKNIRGISNKGKTNQILG